MNASASQVSFLVRVSVAAAFALLVSGTAQAATITCPGAPTSTYMEVTNTTGTVTCADWQGGPGSVTGWSGNNGFPNGNDDPLIYKGTNFALVDAEIDGDDAKSGSFTSSNVDLLVLFKFGGGQNNPDWFILFLDGPVSASWVLKDLDNKTNGLSHYGVWGGEGLEINPNCAENCNPPVVPEPASLLLIGTGLFGAAAAKRRASKR